MASVRGWHTLRARQRPVLDAHDSRVIGGFHRHLWHWRGGRSSGLRRQRGSWPSRASFWTRKGPQSEAALTAPLTSSPQWTADEADHCFSSATRASRRPRERSLARPSCCLRETHSPSKCPKWRRWRCGRRGSEHVRDKGSRNGREGLFFFFEKASKDCERGTEALREDEVSGERGKSRPASERGRA